MAYQTTIIFVLIIVIIVWIILLDRNLRRNIKGLQHQIYAEKSNGSFLSNQLLKHQDKSNIYFKAIIELGKLLGYCVVEKHEFEFNVDSLLRGKSPVKKTVDVHKTVIEKKNPNLCSKCQSASVSTKGGRCSDCI